MRHLSRNVGEPLSRSVAYIMSYDIKKAMAGGVPITRRGDIVTNLCVICERVSDNFGSLTQECQVELMGFIGSRQHLWDLEGCSLLGKQLDIVKVDPCP